MNVYHTRIKHRGEVLEIEKVEPKKLGEILEHFFAESILYKPNSLCSMQASIDKYLRGYTHSILKSREFAYSESVLEGKARVIDEDGKGRRPIKVVA